MILEMAIIGALTGAIAGRYAALRARRRALASERAAGAIEAPKLTAPIKIDDCPIDVGDVVLLDEGRGLELCVDGVCALAEHPSDLFFALFSASANDGSRRCIGFDPRTASEGAVLAERESIELPANVPTSLELPTGAIDGPRRAVFRLDARRMTEARVRTRDSTDVSEVTEVTNVTEVTDGSDVRNVRDALPKDGESTVIALYRSAPDRIAIVARPTSGRSRVWTGNVVRWASTSILRRDAR